MANRSPGRNASRARVYAAASLSLLACAFGVGLTGFSSARGTAGETPSSPSPSTASPAPAPSKQPPPQLTQAQVNGAVGQLDGLVGNVMAQTGVPGVAVAVVYQDKVVYSKGFGVREVGKADKVDPDTVFLLASVSKPLATTIVAGEVGKKVVGWDDPIIAHDPGFALKDPYVSANVTLADMFSHRSGLPDHAGDLLEDLGYQQDYILQHLRQEPLDPFRSSYAYTNMGFTEAGVAVADAAKTTWPDLASTTLFKPLGMGHSSYQRSDFDKAADRATPSVQVDGRWQASTTQNADAQAPAGGASSTVDDMAQWLRLQLGDGTYNGKQLIDAAALSETRSPHAVTSPLPASAGQPGMYGLGFNVSYDSQGRLRISHSGAFSLGVTTNVTLLPTEQLGIVVLTNGEPVGQVEAISAGFLDYAQYGRQTVDWLGFFAKQYQALKQHGLSPTDYTKPPADTTPAKAPSAYSGTYANDYYGPLTVTSDAGGNLSMTLGPQKMSFPLKHYTGDTFYYQTQGENAVGLSGVTFHLGSGGGINRVTVEHLDANQLGTFTR